MKCTLDKYMQRGQQLPEKSENLQRGNTGLGPRESSWVNTEVEILFFQVIEKWEEPMKPRFKTQSKQEDANLLFHSPHLVTLQNRGEDSNNSH